MSILPFNITNPGIWIDGVLTTVERQYVTALVLAGGTASEDEVLTWKSGAPSWEPATGGGGGGVWGSITGTLSSQTDLQAALDAKVTGPASASNGRIVTFDGTTGKLVQDGGFSITQVRDRANHTGTQLASTISDFNSASDARIAAAAGVSIATLSGGKIPSSQLPPLALTEVFTVASQVAQLALTAEEGDVAIRTDQNKSYIHNGGSSGTMTDWSELLTPTDTVLSVNGEVGAVTLTTDDISDSGQTNKWASAAEKTKLSFITVTQSVDLDTLESDTATNNAKVTNATHTGDVTGATALTAQPAIITGKPSATVAGGDLVLIVDVSDSNNLKQVTAQSIADLGSGGGGGSGINRSVTVTSGNVTAGSAASTDYVYFVAGAHTVSLPAASGNTNLYTIKNNHTANITIDTVGSETIDGTASIIIAPEESVQIISDGTNFNIV